MHRLYLPAYFRVGTMYQAFSEVIAEDGEPLHREVCIDLSRLRFIDHDGITIVANLIEWLRKRDVTVSFNGADVSRGTVSYLDDCGFFSTYFGESLRAEAVPRETTMPFRSVLCTDSHGWLELSVTPWLANVLNVSEASLYEMRASIREIFNNIEDHSTERIGCMHVQWYPNERNIGLSISDFGVGIPAELGRAHEFENDGAALALAVQDQVTSKPDGRNQGAGLAILLDTVLTGNGGSVGIYSGHGQLVCESGLNGRNVVPLTVDATYPGTLFSIKLRSDRIENREEEREDLEW